MKVPTWLRCHKLHTSRQLRRNETQNMLLARKSTPEKAPVLLETSSQTPAAPVLPLLLTGTVSGGLSGTVM